MKHSGFLVALLLASANAGACSVARIPPSETLKKSDAAVVAVPVRITYEPGNATDSSFHGTFTQTVNWRVTRRYKGTLATGATFSTSERMDRGAFTVAFPPRSLDGRRDWFTFPAKGHPIGSFLSAWTRRPATSKSWGRLGERLAGAWQSRRQPPQRAGRVTLGYWAFGPCGYCDFGSFSLRVARQYWPVATPTWDVVAAGTQCAAIRRELRPPARQRRGP